MLLERPHHLPAGQPGWLYAEVHGVRTHMVSVWSGVVPGGKKGPGSRNPPILTSCFCWKDDLRACHHHQHRAQCSRSSRGDGMFMRRATHHTKSGCQHPEIRAGVFPLTRWRNRAKTIPFNHAAKSPVTHRSLLAVSFIQEVAFKQIKMHQVKQSSCDIYCIYIYFFWLAFFFISIIIF